MKELNKKYQIGTEENKAFLEEVRNSLLSFGHKFPAPGGSSYYLGDDGTPWTDRNRETWITSVWLTFTALALSWDMKEAKSW